MISTRSRWFRVDCGGDGFDADAALRAAVRASSRVTHLGLACRHEFGECRRLEAALRAIARRKKLAFAAPRA